MRRTLFLVCLLLSLIAALNPAAAQNGSGAVESAPDSPPLVLRLPAATVLYHIGDDPSCALPPGTPGASACTWHSGPTPLAWHLQSGWHRSEIDLPPQLSSAPELSLLVQGARPVFEVYADGTLIGRSGSFASHNGPVYDSIIVPIPARLYRKGHLSISSRRLNGPNPYVPSLLLPALGTPAALVDLQKSDTLAQLAQDSQYFLSEVFLSGAGVLFLLLFALNRTSREYLWMALFLIAISVPHIADIGEVVNIGEPFWLSGVFYGAFNALFAVAMVEFPFALIRRPVWPVLRIVQVLLCLYLFKLLLLLPWSLPNYVALQRWLSPLIEYVFIPVLIPASLVFLVAVPTCLRSRQREMQWVGAALIFLAACLTDRYLGQLGFPFAPQSLRVGAVALDFTTLALSVFSAVMIVTMLIRFRRIQSRNQTVEQDLAAARSVQQVLIPDALPQVPGLNIASAYLPAQEVGGDFFQVLPLASGGAFIVVGDVAGKGLQAAMTVAVIVGTLRAYAETYTSPGDLLSALNRQLCGRGTSFATCLALAVNKSGRVRIANAGHLNPYLDGAEVPTEPDLPLGVTNDATYSVTELNLLPAQTLTLMTDGVVEATNPHTRELFGFARTQAISNESADNIAHTAHLFGIPQADDITVLTLSCPA